MLKLFDFGCNNNVQRCRGESALCVSVFTVSLSRLSEYFLESFQGFFFFVSSDFLKDRLWVTHYFDIQGTRKIRPRIDKHVEIIKSGLLLI